MCTRDDTNDRAANDKARAYSSIVLVVSGYGSVDKIVGGLDVLLLMGSNIVADPVCANDGRSVSTTERRGDGRGVR